MTETSTEVKVSAEISTEMSFAEQKALSRAHSNAMIYILPLSNGQFAVFDRTHELHAIVDALPDATELRAISARFLVHVETKTRAEYRRMGAEIIDSEGREIPLLDIRIPVRKTTVTHPRVEAVEIEL